MSTFALDKFALEVFILTLVNINTVSFVFTEFESLE